MKAVQDMTAAELLEEQRRREENRRLNRPLDFVAEQPPAADEIKRANVLEKDEQWVITKMARAIGFTVRSTSQARASKVAPGIPDLILSHRDRQFFGFWETKRQVGGKLSTAQIEFAEDCHTAGVACGSGDRYAFANWLGHHRFTPPPPPRD